MKGKGIVTSVRRAGDSNEYVIFDGENYHKVVSKKRIRTKSVSFSESDIEELKESVLEEVKRRFFRKIRYNVELPREIAFLRREIERLWKELAFVRITGEKPLVYFDADADGMVSLLLISEAVKVNFKPMSPWNLELGSNLYPDLRAPFYLLLDLGSTPDARAGVSLLSSLRPLFIVDHHYSDSPPKDVLLVNPSLRDPILSRYTTAILTSYIVKPWVDRPNWVRTAAAGDRSDVIEWTREDRKKALALEIAPEVFGMNLYTMKQILDGDLWKPLWELFKSRIEKIEEIAEKEELDIGGKKVLIVRYASPGFYYPHRGKVASYYQEECGYDVVIVEETPKVKLFTVSLRGNVDFFPLLERMKDLGLAKGWGHPQAVTLKTEDPETLEKEILGWLENEGSSKDDRG